MSGRGTVWSFIVPHPPLLPAYAEVAPYNVVVVASTRTRRSASSATSSPSPTAPINEIDPATMQIGEPVRVVFDTEVDGIRLPMWTPA